MCKSEDHETFIIYFVNKKELTTHATFGLVHVVPNSRAVPIPMSARMRPQLSKLSHWRWVIRVGSYYWL